MEHPARSTAPADRACLACLASSPGSIAQPLIRSLMTAVDEHQDLAGA